jgi:hypothetical protein
MAHDRSEVFIVTGRWKAEGLEDPPDDSVVGTPPRRPGSIRRTSHINMTWPEGDGTPMHLDGRSRDLITDASGSARIVGLAEMHVVTGEGRTIRAITTVPGHAGVGSLIGSRGGQNFRAAIDDALPGERQSGTPLHFILDDIAGCTLIGGFAWCQHRPMVYPTEASGPKGSSSQPPGGLTRKGRIICSGLRPGGYHQISRERQIDVPHFLRVAGDIDGGDDPWAWHLVDPAPAVCMRRRRRLDSWLDGDQMVVDAHFRDSMWSRDHHELVVHEYTLSASIEAATRVLTGVEATPRVLPFPECPWASGHVGGLVGMKVDGFRTSVQDSLTELHCCTHLNDMLRGLAEIPALVGGLRQACG